jgi:hypothetical protein
LSAETHLQSLGTGDHRGQGARCRASARAARAAPPPIAADPDVEATVDNAAFDFALA